MKKPVTQPVPWWHLKCETTPLENCRRHSAETAIPTETAIEISPDALIRGRFRVWMLYWARGRPDRASKAGRSEATRSVDFGCVGRIPDKICTPRHTGLDLAAPGITAPAAPSSS